MLDLFRPASEKRKAGQRRRPASGTHTTVPDAPLGPGRAASWVLDPYADLRCPELETVVLPEDRCFPELETVGLPEDRCLAPRVLIDWW